MSTHERQLIAEEVAKTAIDSLDQHENAGEDYDEVVNRIRCAIRDEVAAVVREGERSVMTADDVRAIEENYAATRCTV